MSCSYPNCTTNMRRTRRKGSVSTVLIVVLLLICLTTDCIIEGFLVTSATLNSNSAVSNHQLRSLFHDRAFKSSPLLLSSSKSRLKATKEDEHLTEEETWSGSGDEKSSSRFGVRKRVRAVLEKAKNRTGIRNSNSETDDTNDNDKLFSIGGFEKDPNLVSTPASSNGSNGASTPTTNGASTPTTNGSAQPVNGSAKPVNGAAASVNGSAAPVNGSAAPVNGSVAPVNGSGAPVNGSVAPVESKVASEPSAKKPSKGNAAIPGEILTGQVNKMLNSNLPEEPLEPLPFTLPQITSEQRKLLANGERIQEQSKMGREGSGFVVVDVKAPPYAVWEILLDFEEYPKNIGTVRSMNMFTNEHLKSSYISEKPVLPGTGRATRRYGNASITRAKFVLSKFRLNIAAIHKYRPHPDGHYMVFTLDRACTNAVLQDAKGIWYTQNNPDSRGEEYTRVWLFCEVKVSPLLPSFIVDYAANRAMPRATTWLKPTVEAAAKEWLKKD
jgi:hypothetical protein